MAKMELSINPFYWPTNLCVVPLKMEYFNGGGQRTRLCQQWVNMWRNGRWEEEGRELWPKGHSGALGHCGIMALLWALALAADFSRHMTIVHMSSNSLDSLNSAHFGFIFIFLLILGLCQF
jgi:hypothetical protein